MKLFGANCVGARQEFWKPLETHCPLDGQLEMVTHSCGFCYFLQAAFDSIQKCFPIGSVSVHTLTTSDIESIESKQKKHNKEGSNDHDR